MATQPNTHLAGIVGANIRRARLEKDLTQQDLAARLDTSISRVSGWEGGKHLPRRGQYGPLADLLFGGDQAALFREATKEAAA